jgi:hypothetical protein
VTRRVSLVASVLVHNEDVFLERAIRNVADACDRVHVLDHVSTDRTPEILSCLAVDFDHVEIKRSSHAAASHRMLEHYAGTPTWVIGVDGDEIFDPVGLGRLVEALRAGAYADTFRLKAHVLNCDELDEGGLAHGYLSPPSRPVTKLFNMGAVTRWTGCAERLHAGSPMFRPGFGWDPLLDLATSTSWDTDPLRCLHVCFLRRSSRETFEEVGNRRNLDETRAFRRGAGGALYRLVRRPKPSPGASRVQQLGTTWKRDWYTRGPRVSVDATPFLGDATS